MPHFIALPQGLGDVEVGQGVAVGRDDHARAAPLPAGSEHGDGRPAGLFDDGHAASLGLTNGRIDFHRPNLARPRPTGKSRRPTPTPPSGRQLAPPPRTAHRGHAPGHQLESSSHLGIAKIDHVAGVKIAPEIGHDLQSFNPLNRNVQEPGRVGAAHRLLP